MVGISVRAPPYRGDNALRASKHRQHQINVMNMRIKIYTARFLLVKEPVRAFRRPLGRRNEPRELRCDYLSVLSGLNEILQI